MSKLRMREELVETVPKMEEIGIQYSARPENSERSRGQTRNAACVAIDTVSLAIEAHLD